MLDFALHWRTALLTVAVIFLFTSPSIANGIDSISGTDLPISAGGTPSILVQHDTGNVGIGTTDPSQKLEVVGDIKVTGAISASDNINASGYTINGVPPETCEENQASRWNGKKWVCVSSTPVCRVCMHVDPHGSDGQCKGDLDICSGWSNNPTWSPEFADDTDGRAGGCSYSFLMECK